jgi:hypothetical protein
MRARKLEKRGPGENEVVLDCRLCGYRSRIEGSQGDARERSSARKRKDRREDQKGARPSTKLGTTRVVTPETLQNLSRHPSPSLQRGPRAVPMASSDPETSETAKKRRRPNKRESLHLLLERSKASRRADDSEARPNLLASFLESL